MLSAKLLFNESLSPTMQLMSLFHDFALAIISAVLLFVLGGSLSLITNSLISATSITPKIEFIWTVSPMFILLSLAVPSLRILYILDESNPYMTWKVIGHQWYWSYEVKDSSFDSYMDTYYFRLLDVDNRIVVPYHQEVRTLITGADVIHSWAIPGLGVKADAIPGRLNQVNFSVLRPSILYGQCSEICGANHSFMPISLEAFSLSLFKTWLNQWGVGLPTPLF